MRQDTPLIELSGLYRRFPAGDTDVTILDDIHLTIARGEMVAIMGQSGSGKSTLMNILGGLDQPSSGSYRFDGVEVGSLDDDGLAALRREHFGFIFQRYHLIPALTASENVAMPAIYAGMDNTARAERAGQLLGRLGLTERLHHKPSQLSGGQQQRVSIARALMNGGEVILADEPTGALDSRSGEEVLATLKELHARGHTVILVTHDANVAALAERVIEIKDGRIVDDRRNPGAHDAEKPGDRPAPPAHPAGLAANWGRFLEAFSMAWRSLVANRLRTLLTMLGIIIGIASVVSIVALGEGMQQSVLQNLSSLGATNIDIMPGSGLSDDRSGGVRTLRESDLLALAAEPYVEAVTPMSQKQQRMRFGNVDSNATVYGVSPSYFDVRGQKIEQGSNFSRQDVQRQAQVAVIGETTRQTFFGDGSGLGEIILIGNVPLQVIGVAEAKSSGWGGDSLEVWVPYSTAASRIFGQQYFNRITVKVRGGLPTKAAEEALTQRLLLAHGTQDFYTRNMEDILSSVEASTRNIKLFLTMIGVISLVVGGIGVMNIMLVSVTERTHEIGIRMAVGARQSDIMRQFLIEAVMVCMVGGGIGIALSLGLGAMVDRLMTDFKMIFSLESVLTAVLCATLVGVVFGFLPARRAARLAPIEALARE
ncbi:macrolide export ATP-binding/permease protein MacB [Chitiniphilus shinanonensis]|uniref:Macrolide export ATP-binding/permease protein MacB n=1 Tax=Chitiniphilus shinanonensis TaxID=553088 RepID=A0ABQ6BNX3_9NEIS|nr:MacB family efflux pump subunit [Chitiniphilus shinanonensis]GLS03147.1 macrolide export ATP-binding/permease protein MacB [Chitiniphilus shinanonensis]